MPSLRKYFATGLLILVPLGITLWVVNLIITTMDRTLLLLPEDVRARFPFNVPGMGAVLTLLVILGVGLLTANFVGRRLVTWWEALLRRIPVVNFIYSSVKQVSDTLFSPSGQAFRKAVLVQFPREGTWAVGFVVGSPGESITAAVGAGAQTVYIPTAPNPTSGYIVIVAPSELVELDISVDAALKFVVSMGVAAPIARMPGMRELPHALR
jgi:uncharacterized membrane protein